MELPNLSLDRVTEEIEKLISSIYSHDFNSLQAELDLLSSRIGELSSQSIKYRSSLSSLSSQQQLSRVTKICDQIDSVASLDLSQQALCSSLVFNADGEIRRQTRNKLKVIDDMASSSKLTKASGFEGKIIRSIITSIQESLDNLESLQARYGDVIAVVSRIRDLACNPINSFDHRCATLFPEAESLEKKKIDLEQMQKLQKEFQLFGDVPEFQQASVLKQEMEFIERQIGERLHPLRIFTKRYQFDDQNNAVGSGGSGGGGGGGSGPSASASSSLGKQKSVAAATASSEEGIPPTSAGATPTVNPHIILVNLTSIIACSDAELMQRCLEKNTLASLMTFFVATKNYVCDSVSKTDESFAKLRATLDSLPTELLRQVEDFDVEYFQAYCEDWQERYHFLSTATASREFQEKYKKYMNLRATLRTAQEKVENDLRAAMELLQRFDWLKRRVQEVFHIYFNRIVCIETPELLSRLKELYELTPQS